MDGSDPSPRRRWLRRLGLGVAAFAGCTGLTGSEGTSDGETASTDDGSGTGSDGDGSGTGSDGDDPADGDDGSADGNESTDDGGEGSDEGGDADPIHPEYETREVDVETPDGDPLGSVTAAIADTRELRYTGLSDTETLPEDRGMLFVYDAVRNLTYVMRAMDCGIDIVYADADGVITRIHHAPAPGPDEDGEEREYPGRGRYVLEVAYEWTADRGVSVGDVLRFDPVT
jgi:uncharacterized membrane protein (UPF0127 family)